MIVESCGGFGLFERMICELKLCLAERVVLREAQPAD